MDTFMDQLSQKLNAQEIIRANGEAETEQMVVMRAQVKEYQDCLDKMKMVAEEIGGIQARIEMLPEGGTASSLSPEAIDELKDQIREITKGSEAQIEAIRKATEDKLEDIRKSNEEQLVNIRRENVEQLKAVEQVSEDLGGIGAQIATLSSKESSPAISEELIGDLKNRMDELTRTNSEIMSELSKSNGDKLDEIARANGEKLDVFAKANSERIDQLQKTLIESLGSGDDFHKECVRIYRNVQAVVQEECNKLHGEMKDTLDPYEKQIKSVKKAARTAVFFSVAGVIVQFVIHYLL